jgi:hypothetical protein
MTESSVPQLTISDVRSAAQAVMTAHRARYGTRANPEEWPIPMQTARGMDILISTHGAAWEITVFATVPGKRTEKPTAHIVCAVTASGATVSMPGHMATAVQCLRDIAACRIVAPGVAA